MRGSVQSTGRDGTAFSAVGPSERPAGVCELQSAHKITYEGPAGFIGAEPSRGGGSSGPAVYVFQLFHNGCAVLLMRPLSGEEGLQQGSCLGNVVPVRLQAGNHCPLFCNVLLTLCNRCLRMR